MKQTLITKQDEKIIDDVVNTFWNDGYTTIKKQLLRIFAQNITCNHFIVMGQAIGVKFATEKREQKTNKQFYYVSNN